MTLALQRSKPLSVQVRSSKEALQRVRVCCHRRRLQLTRAALSAFKVDLELLQTRSHRCTITAVLFTFNLMSFCLCLYTSICVQTHGGLEHVRLL